MKIPINEMYKQLRSQLQKATQICNELRNELSASQQETEIAKAQDNLVAMHRMARAAVSAAQEQIDKALKLLP